MTCNDSYGDGWNGGSIIIDGQSYCYKFSGRIRIFSDVGSGTASKISGRPGSTPAPADPSESPTWSPTRTPTKSPTTPSNWEGTNDVRRRSEDKKSDKKLFVVDVETEWEQIGKGYCRGDNELTFHIGSRLDVSINTVTKCANRCINAMSCSGFWLGDDQKPGCMTFQERIISSSGEGEGKGGRCFIKYSGRKDEDMPRDKDMASEESMHTM